MVTSTVPNMTCKGLWANWRRIW